MSKKPEESSKNTELSVTSSDNQPIVVGSDAGVTNDDQHRQPGAPSDKQDDPVVAANTVVDQKTIEQYLQARMVSASTKNDTNDPNTNISWIPNFMKSLAGTRSANNDEGSDNSTNTDSDDETSRPDSEVSVESSNLGTNDDGPLPPLQPPITRSAMQFQPILPSSANIPPPLNQWHLYNQQKSFNAPPPALAPLPPHFPEPTDMPSTQAVKKTRRRKSSAKSKTPRKKSSKEKKELDDDRPLQAPALKELPTTAAPRTNFNQAPKSGGPSCQPNYCPPCAQAPNLPPCPPTMTVPSCSQPLSACIPPASAMPGGMQAGAGGYGQSNGCAAAVSDPCNPCISGGYRMNNFQGGSCPDLYPQQSDICRPSNGYGQQQGQCCSQQQPGNCAPVELCEKSVCYCEKCENPDPNVPPQYNMQQWTCKFLRPVENGGYGNGHAQNFDGNFQMPQGGPGHSGGPSGMPAMHGYNDNSSNISGGMSAGMGPGLGPGGIGVMNAATMGAGGMGGNYGGMAPPSAMAPPNAMGYNPMCAPACNPNYGNQPQYQQPTGGRGCPPPGGYGSGCPPPGNPPPPPRCPVPCAPRCPPRSCYQKIFTDWGENDPRDALMSRITVYPQHRASTPMTVRNLAASSQFHPAFNANAHSNIVAYHPELCQVTGAISARTPRFEESIVPQTPRYSNVIRTPRFNAQAYKRPRSIYANKEPAVGIAPIDMAEAELLSTRASQLRYHYSQQRRTDTPRVTPSKKTEIYNGEIDWRSEPKLHSSETVASKLRRQHNRNKLKEINDG